MHFVVRKNPYNSSEVEVRLGEKTKERLKKVLWWTIIATGAGSLVYEFRKDTVRTLENTPAEE